MASEVVDAQQAAAIDAVSQGLDALAAAGVAPFDARDARVLIAELEVFARRMRAFQVDALDGIEQQGLHRVDGHASAKVLVRHVAKLSDAEAHRRAQSAKALRDLPVVRAAFADGRVGGCQVDRIARAYANRRVRERLCRQDDALAVAAAALPFRRFDGLVGDWVRRMDEDGTCDADQRAHEDRDAKLVQDLDGAWALAAGCASLQGAELHDILRRFVDAEFASDWAKARLDHGDDTTVEHLARTDAQRRFDALFEIFQRAATAAANAEGGSQIVTNIVIDHATYQRQLRRLTGTHPGPLDPTLRWQPATPPTNASTDPHDHDSAGSDALRFDRPSHPGPAGPPATVPPTTATTAPTTATGKASPPGRTGGPPATPERFPGHRPPPTIWPPPETTPAHDTQHPPETGPGTEPAHPRDLDDLDDHDHDELDDHDHDDLDEAGSDAARFRCSTLDGHPVEPTAAVAASLLGHVRRVVIGADAVVLDLGRRRRLFTGPAQLAARLQATECYWPGCHVPTTRSQTDHLHAWAHGGTTTPANAGPACARHNRLKTSGYTTHRDPTGTWHTHRPDGTEIT